MRTSAAWLFFRIGCLAMVMIGALGVRLYQLDRRGISPDESFAYAAANRPLGDLLTAVANDFHPPLYFLLLKVWTSAFGDSLWAIRSLSVILGLGTVLGLYLLTAEAVVCAGKPPLLRWSREQAPLVASALVAVSAAHILCSRIARMYSLGTFLAVFSSWLLLRAWRKDKPGTGNWLAYGFTAGLFLLTHHYALFTVAAQWLFLVGSLAFGHSCNWREVVRSPALRHTGLAVCGTASVYGWWAPWLVRQVSEAKANFWIRDASLASAAAGLFRLCVAPDTYLLELKDPPLSTAQAALVFLAVAVLVSAAIWRLGATGILLALLSIVPLLLGIAASWILHRPILLSRYFLFAQLFLVADAAVLSILFPDWLVNFCLAVSLLLSFGLVTLSSWPSQLPNRSGMEALMAEIGALSRGNAVVIAQEPELFAVARYYGRRFPIRLLCYASTRNLPRWRLKAVIGDDEILRPNELANVEASQIWTVQGSQSLPMEIPRRWRLRRYETFREAEPPSLLLQEYVPQQARR